jgi:tetratricopeptide (TPR) repeat protein
LPTFRAIYTEDHTHTATLLNNIARSELMTGDLAHARPLFLEALGIDQKIEVPTHDDFVFLYNSLGMIAAFQGDFVEAGKNFASADRIARMPEHDEILDQVLLNEADVALHTGDKKHAAELLQQSRTALAKAHPNDPLNAWRYAVWDTVAAELTAINGAADSGMATVRAARATIVQHFGEGSYYAQLTDKRTKFINAAARP